MSTRTILVPHDFSTYAEHAADAALDDLLDSKRGGRMVLLHCFQLVMPPPGVELDALGAKLVGAESTLRMDAARALEQVAERLRKRERLLCEGARPVEIEGKVRFAPAVDGILAEIKESDVDRVFVGTHGRSGLNHFLLGSVAERIARLARVPVVIVHGTRADLDEERGIAIA